MNIVLVPKFGLGESLMYKHGISVHSVVKAILVPGGLFLESRGNFLARKLIWEMIQ